MGDPGFYRQIRHTPMLRPLPGCVGHMSRLWQYGRPIRLLLMIEMAWDRAGPSVLATCTSQNDTPEPTGLQGIAREPTL